MIIGIAFSVFFISFVVFAWTSPPGAPPTCPSEEPGCETPLHTGTAGQSKTGGLLLNTGGASTGLIVEHGNVGIGTTNPGAQLHTTGTIRFSGIGHGANRVLISDSLGNATWQPVPIVSVIPTTNANASAGNWVKIPFNSIEIDTHNSFNTTLNRFQPSVAGYYNINLNVHINMVGASGFTLTASIRKNNSSVQDVFQLINYAAGFSQTLRVNKIIYLNGSTDYVDGWFHTNFGTATAVSGAGTGMSAHFIGR